MVDRSPYSAALLKCAVLKMDALHFSHSYIDYTLQRSLVIAPPSVRGAGSHDVCATASDESFAHQVASVEELERARSEQLSLFYFRPLVVTLY